MPTPSSLAQVTGALCQFANDTRSRFFAVLELKSGTPAYAAVGSLIDAVDQVMARYGQPRFYAERRTHISVAWSLAPLVEPLPALDATLGGRIGGDTANVGRHIFAGGGSGSGDVPGLHICWDSVAWRIGERETTFRLGPWCQEKT